MAAASLTGSEEPLLHGEKAEKFGIIKVIATINLNYRFGRDLLGSNVATLGALLAIAAAVLLAIAEPGSTFYTDALWVRIAIPAGMAVLSVAIGLQLKRGGSCPMNLPMQKELGDKTVIITGANSGIGKVATEQFARWGAGKVIMACRNERRGEAAAADVRRATGCRPEQVEFSQCDTSDLGSVRAFVERLGDLRVDIVICNAGIMATPFAVNADGHELQYATNHLGHFLLINLLLPKLKEAPAPRVVIVSSTGHFLAPKRPNWRDTGDASVYHTWRAYGRSKLANALMARELQTRHFDALGPNAVSVSLHPGLVKTNLAKEMRGVGAMLNSISGSFQKTPWQGCQTTLFCATAPSSHPRLEKGGWHADCAAQKCSATARDAAIARELWDISLQQVGLAE